MKSELIIALNGLAIALIALFINVLLGDYYGCKRLGGTLVRGAFWFQCVAPLAGPKEPHWEGR